ncbi:MAG: UDP-glucose/GDP-mannose dehydrogenase family protein [Candidatus Omnitrophica bacterium]|nr:UDP-glucose/GDP-mannose dehydrogenase family protein [Candidatus Omnitrophota bacterium]
MNLCIIGAGHVGLVTAACFAELGHRVVCVDNDKKKIALLKKGKVTFYEPGLSELVRRNLSRKRLLFTDRVSEGVTRSQVIFIAVGTPPLSSGEADLTAVEQVSREIARSMTSYRLVVEKSTVPVETGKWVKKTLEHSVRKRVGFDVASNPEFLREGSAVHDFLHPDRIVIGVESEKARALLSELYRPFKAPLVVTDIASSELIKHASNAFLATKISFINAIACIAEKVGADVTKIAHGMGLDPRIGPAFLNAGAGFGGFCFPKDVEAFIRIAEKIGYDFDLLKAVKRINEEQRRRIVKKIERQMWNLKGKRIGVLGLAFKPDTDDLRFAPALDVIAALQKEGSDVRCYDPVAMPEAKKILKGVRFAPSAAQAAQQADCLVLMTEWAEFKKLDFRKLKGTMRQAVLVDARNMIDPAIPRKAGFRYVGVGRGDDSA